MTGNVVSTGGISVAQGGQGSITVNLNGAGNTFLGPIRFEHTNATQNATVNVASLSDPAGAGKIIFGAIATGTSVSISHNFGVSDVASSPITLSNRQIVLAGTQVVNSINNSGPQAFTINSNLLVTGTTAKNLVLGGNRLGLSAFATSINNNPNPTAPGTVLHGVRTTAASSTLTLASVDGILVGATITGTNTTAGTTITAINPGTRVVTLSANTTGGISLGTVFMIPNVINSISLAKTGNGTWNLTSSNGYTGGTRIDAGKLSLDHPTNTLVDTGLVYVNGGTLALGTSSDTVGPVTLISGNITGSTGVLTGTNYDVRSGSISAILGGFGVNLVKTTGGVVTLAGNNTYTGTTTTSGTGGLVLAANNALGTIDGITTVGTNTSLGLSGNIAYSTAETVVGSGTGANPAAGAFAVSQRGFVQSVSGNNTFAGAIQINATSRSRFGTQDCAQLTLTGPITMATGITGVTVLFRSGNLDGDFVTVTNTGNNWDTATEVFTCNAGTGAGQRVGANNALPTGTPVLTFSGAGSGTTLDLAGFNQEVAGLAHSANGTLRITNSVASTTSILTLSGSTDRDFGTAGVIVNGERLRRNRRQHHRRLGSALQPRPAEHHGQQPG